MSSKTFKVSTLAAFILAATHANAALYRVVEIQQPSGTEAYGSAIQEETGTTSCFTGDCSDGSAYALAGDTLEGTMGFSYKQEVPFNYDNGFYILEQDDLQSYCDNELGYNTCDSWASYQWNGIDGAGGLKRERDAWSLGAYTANATAFKEGEATSLPSPDAPSTPSGDFSPVANTKNIVITALDGTTGIGNTSSGYFSNTAGNYALTYRNRGFYGSALLLPEQGDENIVETMGRSMAFDTFTYDGATYAVGSAAVAPFAYSDADKNYGGDLDSCISSSSPAALQACQNFAFAQKAYIWDVSSAGSTPLTGLAAADWDSSITSANMEEESAQAGIRGAAISSVSGDYSGLPVMAGFNSDYNSDHYIKMQAAVFYPASTGSFSVGENAWKTAFIAGSTVDNDSDINSNSIAKDINQNLLVIGETKRNTAENGAYNNRLFIADASDGSPSASYFSGGIFFSGAGGEANAINNYNEIVGQIDAETHREKSGKKRRRRGFIYPYNGTNTDSTRRAVFSNQAWWLDDLTNDGNASGINNQYRIFNAADINDAGVIAASAFKCAGGYSSTAHFATCDGTEEVVAVKLVPLSGVTSSDILTRAESDNSSTERSGAGLGWLSIALLTLLGIRRKFA